MKLTSHAAAMDLMVQFPGDGMILWQRFRPGSQFFMVAATEHGAQAFVTHWEVV